MQNTFQQTLKNIKARAGRGEGQENFKIGTGAVLVPQNIKLPSFNENSNSQTTQTRFSALNNPSATVFKVPKLSNQFQGSSRQRWISLAFIIGDYKDSEETNNQFVEPLNSQTRGVFKHTPSMRDFGEIKIFLSRQTLPDQPTDIEGLDKEVEYIKNIFKQGAVRLKHPRFGYINGAVNGKINIDRSSLNNCLMSFNFLEVQSDIVEVIPPTPPSVKKVSFFSKIKNTIGTIRDYTFATISEFNSVVSKLDKLSGTLYTTAQTLNALQDNVIGSLEPFNRLAHAIGTFTASTRDLLKFPDKLGSKLEQIGNNFSNINLSLTPTRKNSKANVKKNNTNKQVVKSLLNVDKFTADNSELLSSQNPETKASYEALAMSQQSYKLGLALFTVDNIEFNTVEEIESMESIVNPIASSLIEFQLFLGTDVYGNKVYHRIDFITNEIIELVVEISSLYNDFLLRMQELKTTLETRRSTIIKTPMNITNLVRVLYNGEYNPTNAEEEEELINQLCFLNKIDNFWFISGKIFY